MVTSVDCSKCELASIFYGIKMNDDPKYKSTLGVKNIPNRAQPVKNGEMWLDDKRALDGAEGLWRVHDDLYELTYFVEKHPGGQFWLEATKGTDITEAFESHHISTVPEEMLKKYFVRKAKTLRSSPFTFKEDGFYKTLKRNVREALKTIPKNADTSTKIITDCLLVGAFLFAILANQYWSYTFAMVSGILLACLVIAAHNYGHRKDNFRMHYSDIGFLSLREGRILHILSHHLFTNTVADMQAYVTEPLISMYPHSKSTWLRYGFWIYSPLFLWPTQFYFMFVTRMYQWLRLGHSKIVSKSDFLLATLPLTMIVFGGQPLLPTVGMFLVIVAFHGFFFGFIGFTTTHFHPDIFIDGDKSRPENERDWGINQLDTVSDRYEVTGNLFLVLVTFGDHALHHLFPTFDHGVLHHLYPVVQKTMKEFDVDIRMTSHVDMFGGYFRQLAKDKPNPNPPNLLKSKHLKHC